MEGEQQQVDPMQQVAAAIQTLAHQQQSVIEAQRQQAAQLEALAAQRQQVAPPPPSMTDLDAANKALLDQFVQNPLRVMGEAISTAEQRAEAKLRSEMARERQEREHEAALSAWERGWLEQNPDIRGTSLKAFERVLAETDQRRPYAERVEQAAAYVRQMHHAEAQAYAQAMEHERRRKAGTAMPSPSGYGDPSAAPPIDELAMRREMVQHTKQQMLAKRMKFPREAAQA